MLDGRRSGLGRARLRWFPSLAGAASQHAALVRRRVAGGSAAGWLGGLAEVTEHALNAVGSFVDSLQLHAATALGAFLAVPWKLLVGSSF